jgi:hypothetical protein
MCFDDSGEGSKVKGLQGERVAVFQSDRAAEKKRK